MRATVTPCEKPLTGSHLRSNAPAAWAVRTLVWVSRACCTQQLRVYLVVTYAMVAAVLGFLAEFAQTCVVTILRSEARATAAKVAIATRKLAKSCFWLRLAAMLAGACAHRPLGLGVRGFWLCSTSLCGSKRSPARLADTTSTIASAPNEPHNGMPTQSPVMKPFSHSLTMLLRWRPQASSTRHLPC